MLFTFLSYITSRMALFSKRELPDGSLMSIWKIEEDETTLRAALSLFPEERNALDQMRSLKSRIGHLAARVALKQLLPSEPVLSLKDQQGKPYLPHIPGYISLSHSGIFGVAMMHAVHPVGVDIELMSEKIWKVAPKFLKKEERLWAHSVDALYACWCLKESAFKWYGKRGISLKDHMTVQPFSFGSSNYIQLSLNDGDQCFNLSFGYEKIAGYMLAYIRND